MPNKRKTILAISDLHCGHRSGLTPPEYWTEIDDKWCVVREQCWNWFTETLKEVGPVDITILAGDAIDGTGAKSGGTELIITDRLKQAKMAIKCLEAIETKTLVMVRGTGYHTGNAEDFEDYIAEKIGAKHIGDHDWYEVNGVIIDAKHHLGATSIPYGDATPLLKEKIWNDVWHKYDEQPDADILIRGHVHSYCAVSKMVSGKMKLSMSLPALQGMGSKFGSRSCQKHVDFGFIVITVEPNGSYSWKPYLAVLPAQKAQTLKL